MNVWPIWMVWNQDDDVVELHTYVDTADGVVDRILATLPVDPE